MRGVASCAQCVCIERRPRCNCVRWRAHDEPNERPAIEVAEEEIEDEVDDEEEEDEEGENERRVIQARLVQTNGHSQERKANSEDLRTTKASDGSDASDARRTKE